MPTLADLGEFEVIRRLAAVRSETTGIVTGAGDDAAVLRPTEGCDLVVTADAFVEGRHYLAAWMSAEQAGRRLATANLSDLAAMAATPRWALHSIGVRGDQEIAWLEHFERGVDRGLAEAGASVVGGNLTATEGPAWADLTLMGESPRGAAWTRAGAREGDLLVVTGWPGRAGAGWRLIHARGEKARGAQWSELIDAWVEPEARHGLALALLPLGAVTAAVDLSDGVAGDAGHLCEASGAGAVLDESVWPEDPLLARAAAELGVPLNDLRLGPSDDYELLLAVRPGALDACLEIAQAHDVPLHVVGRVVRAGQGLMWLGKGGATPLGVKGFEHFG
jgi:thiamine-monophosphate kinase